MNFIKYLLFLSIILYNKNSNAQKKIEGKYNHASKIFETNNKNYWVGFFENGVARIYKDGYVGLADSAGNILCVPKYDEIFLDDKKVYRVSLNNKYGLIDKNGIEILKPCFSSIDTFFGDLAVFTSENIGHRNKFGILKSDGNVFKKAEFSYIGNRQYLGFFYIKNDEFDKLTQIGIIDFKGTENEIYNKEFITQALRDKEPSISALTYSLLSYNEGYFHVLKKVDTVYKYGFMNNSFKIAIEPKYDLVEDFKNGFALVSNNDKWGVIDKGGNQIIPIKYTSIKQAYNDRFIVNLNNKYGVVDSKNMIVISIKYNPIFELSDSLYATHNGEKWGVINENEKVILPYYYDGITPGNALKIENAIPLPTGLVRTRLYIRAYDFDKFGKIEEESFLFSYVKVGGVNKYLGNPSFFMPSHNSYNWFGYTEQSERINNVSINKRYYNTIELKNGYKVFWVEDSVNYRLFLGIKEFHKNYKYGIIDNNNKIIVPTIYDNICNNGYNEINLFVVKLNEKWGVIDLKNNIIIPFENDQIVLGRGFFIVSKQIEPDKWESAVFDFLGNELIPFSSTTYNIVGDGFLKRSGGQYQSYFIDKKGFRINLE